MNITIVSQNGAADIAAKLQTGGNTVASFDWSNAFPSSDAVILDISAQPAVSTPPQDAAYPLEPSKAAIANYLAGFARIADRIDAFAAAYTSSGCKAPIIVAGAPIDFTVGYLYKKHGITAYGIAPKAANAAVTLLADTGVQNINPENIDYSAAGVGDMLWLYSIKDKAGKDLYPALRKAVESETLAVPRFELSLSSIKSLKFFGYWHTASAHPETAQDAVAKLIGALSSGGGTIYLTTVNREYIYGIDVAPVTVPCKISAGGISIQKAELPLQCVLASNDYAGALLTAVSALAMRSREVFKRAVKLDPYIASILTLDEADALAEAILKSDAAVSAFFGGK